MSTHVVLKTFSSRYEAEAVRSLLAGSSIESFIVSDDCGSVDPGLGFGRGVDLLVKAEDRDQALCVMLDVPTAEVHE